MSRAVCGSAQPADPAGALRLPGGEVLLRTPVGATPTFRSADLIHHPFFFIFLSISPLSVHVYFHVRVEKKRSNYSLRNLALSLYFLTRFQIDGFNSKNCTMQPEAAYFPKFDEIRTNLVHLNKPAQKFKCGGEKRQHHFLLEVTKQFEPK